MKTLLASLPLLVLALMSAQVARAEDEPSSYSATDSDPGAAPVEPIPAGLFDKLELKNAAIVVNQMDLGGKSEASDADASASKTHVPMERR